MLCRRNIVSLIGAARGLLLSRPLSTTQHARRCASHQDQHQDQHQSQEEYDEEDVEDNIRATILDSALDYVPELGWSRDSIVEGARAAGYGSLTHGLFSRGGVDLALYFYAAANADLVSQLQHHNALVDAGEAEKKRISMFIRDAVETRLRMLEPFVDTWPQAMGLLALPQNIPDSLRQLTSLADDIWYEAGDRSVDFNYYTKRASLAALYRATELHLLQDTSPDFADTWHFLDRRLENLAAFGKGVRKVTQGKDILGDMIWSTFLTGRNILSMNDRQR